MKASDDELCGIPKQTNILVEVQNRISQMLQKIVKELNLS